MGQAEIIKFLERKFYKNPLGFTKEEIENGIKKKIKDYSLIVLVESGEVYREIEIIKGKGFKSRRYRYRYLPNDSFIITNFRG